MRWLAVGSLRRPHLRRLTVRVLGRLAVWRLTLRRTVQRTLLRGTSERLLPMRRPIRWTLLRLVLRNSVSRSTPHRLTALRRRRDRRDATVAARREGCVAGADRAGTLLRAARHRRLLVLARRLAAANVR